MENEHEIIIKRMKELVKELRKLESKGMAIGISKTDCYDTDYHSNYTAQQTVKENILKLAINLCEL